MQPRFTPQQDPADWCATIAVSFLALVWWRLGIPSQIYFDELHYVNAARMLLDGVRANPEHPMLGKEAIAAAMRLLGDQPLYWRVPSALSGALGLFAFSRLIWFASGRRAATIAATFLLATNFMWFVQSRIAMLDMVMAGLGMVGLWQFAAAIRLPTRAAGGWRSPGWPWGWRWGPNGRSRQPRCCRDCCSWRSNCATTAFASSPRAAAGRCLGSA